MLIVDMAPLAAANLRFSSREWKCIAVGKPTISTQLQGGAVQMIVPAK